MKRKIILIQLILAVVLSVLCGVAFSGCGKSAEIEDVKIIAADDVSLGKSGAVHVLTYSTNAESVEVEIKKGGEIATDAEFNAEHNTIIFGSAGSYTVKVTATNGRAKKSAEVGIEITLAESLAVTLSLDKTAVAEDGEVMLTHSVTYGKGDVCKEESVFALYRKDTTHQFREADPASYTVDGDKFTPRAAGEWKVGYRALGIGGGEGEATASLTCTPLSVSLARKIYGVQRIQTHTPAEFDYYVEGAADKYDVSYDMHGKSGIEAEKGVGNSVRLTATAVDRFTVTVVYSHKVYKTIQEKVDIEVYSVESLAYAPIWGEDPFDGMPSEVLTSMGHMLYFNATTKGGEARKLTYQNVKYEVRNVNVTADASVNVMYASDNENYPYVIVSNFGNNSATGSFTVKMTITDPATGYSAVAEKDFTVLPTGTSDEKAGGTIRDYVKNNSFFHIEKMDFSFSEAYSRENMVLTKTGTIMHRRNATDFSPGNFARMDFDSPASNWRMEFKFTLLGANPSTGEVMLKIGMHTQTWGSKAGYFDLHRVGGRLDVTNGLATPISEYSSTAERPLAQSGATMYVRFECNIKGSLAEYSIYGKMDEAAPYELYYRCNYNVSTAAGNPGAPAKAFQLEHRDKGGCYAVENLTLTNYA